MNISSYCIEKFALGFTLLFEASIPHSKKETYCFFLDVYPTGLFKIVLPSELNNT